MKISIKFLLKITFFAILLFFSAKSVSFSQVELIDVSDNVYSFSERMYNKGIIEYNSASIPLSKEAVSKLLIEVNNQQNKLTSVDKLRCSENCSPK